MVVARGSSYVLRGRVVVVVAAIVALVLQLFAVGVRAACVAGGCGPGGKCLDNGECDCANYFRGESCETAFTEQYGGWWTFFRVVGGVLFIPVLIINVVSLSVRGYRRGRCIHSASIRDGSMVFNALGCLARAIFILDPKGTLNILDPTIADGIVLRSGQTFWMLAYFSEIIVFFSVSRSVNSRGRERPKALLWTVGALMTFLVVVGFPIDIVNTFVHTFVLGLISNSLFLLYLLGLTIAGVVYGCRMRLLLKKYRVQLAGLQAGTAAARAARHMAAVIAKLSAVVGSSVFFSALAIGSFIVNTALGARPFVKPTAYFVFLCMIHLIVEPGFAWTLLYSSWQPLRSQQSDTIQAPLASSANSPDKPRSRSSRAQSNHSAEDGAEPRSAQLTATRV